jgi:hypothetical protein
MRRIIFFVLGILEGAVAVVLLLLGLQLPARSEVERGFRAAERVSGDAGIQVRILRHQVQDLRRPELQQLAARVKKQTHVVTAMLRSQQVDFDTVRTMRDALGESADGLDGLAAALDGSRVVKLGNALGSTADLLEERVIPGAARAADRIDAGTRALAEDGRTLSALLKEAPLDLKTVREVHDSLAHFGAGLDRMGTLMKEKRLDAMRIGFRGLEEALTTGAEQVEKLAGVTYPVVQLNGLKPEVEQKKLWPEGDKIAEGMRKGKEGLVAAGKEVDTLKEGLPKLRGSLDESRKMVNQTREALATALAQQAKLEPVLKQVPSTAARLAEELPRIGEELSRVLRDTGNMKEVAASLRQAQKGIDAAVEHWPELRTALRSSAKLLRTTRGQLDKAVSNRKDYRAAMNQSVVLAETFATLLPLLTDQLDNRLDEEEQALNNLEQSLGDVQMVLPVYARTADHILLAGRWLAWLVAAIAGLHGIYLILSARLGRRFSF